MFLSVVFFSAVSDLFIFLFFFQVSSSNWHFFSPNVFAKTGSAVSAVNMKDKTVAKPSFQEFHFMESAIIAVRRLMGFQSPVYRKTNKTSFSFLPDHI